MLVLMDVSNITFQLKPSTRRCHSVVLSHCLELLTPVIHFCRLPDTLFMAKNVAVVIQEDPRNTHRPVEALRIALGLASGSHVTTVVLLGEAARLLGDETDDIIDVDILEKYLPSIEQLGIPFILPAEPHHVPIRHGFSFRRENDRTISSIIQSMDCALVF